MSSPAAARSSREAGLTESRYLCQAGLLNVNSTACDLFSWPFTSLIQLSLTCLEVEYAERDEGQKAGDDQLGEVVVPEYVVQVHSQAGEYHV